ncbi:MAG: hypothetical protein ACK5NF_03470 [Bacilli bacterium]
MSQYKQFFQKIINKSDSNNWESAVLEWKVKSCTVRKIADKSCICGHENIKYLFEIENMNNGNIIYPIGSSCIKKFKREDLDENTNKNIMLFKLIAKISEGSQIQLNSEFFSRKLILYLYELGIFEASKYNGYNAEKDYDFMIDMYNKRKQLTTKQEQKVYVLINRQIVPKLQNLAAGGFTKVEQPE